MAEVHLELTGFYIPVDTKMPSLLYTSSRMHRFQIPSKTFGKSQIFPPLIAQLIIIFII